MPGSRWSRRFGEAFTDRLGYKAGAFALAVVLWVAASGEEPASRYVTVRFAPVLDSGVRLVDPPPRVRALVEGPARELLKLYTTPPAIHPVFGRETPDSMRVTLRPVDVDLPTGVARLTVSDVQPHAIVLRFVNVARRRGSVPNVMPNGIPNDTPGAVPIDTAVFPSAAAATAAADSTHEPLP
jgi:hypothetical protein